MRISPTLPDVVDTGWYNTTESIAHMGMERTTFWRLARAEVFVRKRRKIDGKYWYLGKSLKDVWREFEVKRGRKRQGNP